MSEEKELDQIENESLESDVGLDTLDNFVELDDLQNLEGLDDLSGLGDLSDLSGEGIPEEGISEVKADDEISLDHLDIPGLEDIAGLDIEEPEEPVITESESSTEDTTEKYDTGDEEIDSMLEGLLDSLDINGSIDVPEDETTADTVAEPEPVDMGTEIGDVPLEILEDTDVSIDKPEPVLADDGSVDIEPESSVSELTLDDGSSIELEEDDDTGMGIDGMLDDLMMAHNPDFMDALGLDINGEEKLPEDIKKDAEERKKKKEKQVKRLKKEKEALEEGEGVKEKRPGFFKRLFGNVVTEEIAEAERQAKLDEEEKAKIKAEEKVKDEQEKQAKKELKAEEKQLKKEEKAAKKAKKAEEKAAKKAEKAAKKAEEKELEEKEVVGKLNKAGVTVVVVCAVIVLSGVIIGTNIFGYRLSRSETEKYFQLKRYSDAYKEAIGSKLQKKDPDEYEKIVTVMKVQQSLDTYSSYTAMKYYPDALNALLRGLQKYDENIDTARDLEVDGDLKVCRDKILGILKDEFRLSESQAYAILNLDNESYINRVVSIAKKKI